jgi:HK97 family phage prohead protease
MSKGDALKPSLRPAGDAPDRPPASAQQRQRVSATLRAAQITPAGFVEGYASLFGVEDQGRDVVMAGAFRASLGRRPAAGVRLLFQHDPAEPIGVWDEIREDARGLYVRGHLIEEVVRAREVLALIRAGALDGLSIGFHTRRAVRDARTGQRRLYEIDLMEISIVTFPMLPGARVNAMKAGATAACSPARPRPAPDRPSPNGRCAVPGLLPSGRAALQRACEARPGGA